MKMERRILRSQYSGRTQRWTIVEKTYNGSGGWKRFSTNIFESRTEAEAMIDDLVKNGNGEFAKE